MNKQNLLDGILQSFGLEFKPGINYIVDTSVLQYIKKKEPRVFAMLLLYKVLSKSYIRLSSEIINTLKEHPPCTN